MFITRTCFHDGLPHYTNMPMQYAGILKSVEIVFLDEKNRIFFLSFAQNVDCGYTLESPQ